jgi:hypothetical protein
MRIKEQHAQTNPLMYDFYIDFFKLVGEPEKPLLMACLLESSFANVRKERNLGSSYFYIKVDYIF